MMTFNGAIISTVITLLGWVYQYHCSLRIYNRFALPVTVTVNWKEEDDTSKVNDIIPLDHNGLEPLQQTLLTSNGGPTSSSSSTYSSSTSFKTSSSSFRSKKKKPFFPSSSSLLRAFSGYKSASTVDTDEDGDGGGYGYGDNSESGVQFQRFHNGDSEHGDDDNRSVQSRRTMASAVTSVHNNNIPVRGNKSTLSLYAGYLTMQLGSTGSSQSRNRGGGVWTRQYFVLRGSFGLIYSSKGQFDTQPGEPVNKRAISFQGYNVSVDMSEDSVYRLLLTPSNEDDDDDDSRTNRSSSNSGSNSIGKIWEFRCDTVEEMNEWKFRFLQAAR